VKRVAPIDQPAGRCFSPAGFVATEPDGIYRPMAATEI
jgi:hypothetical protein